MDFGEAYAISERHEATLHRSRGVVSKHRFKWKKLKHRTWLVHRPVDENTIIASDVTGDTWSEEHYALRVFDKTIIRFYRDRLELRDHGYFSRTTFDRFNEYLPRGWRVYGRTFPFLRKFGVGPIGFITTPRGTFPYQQGLTFYYNGLPRDNVIDKADAVMGMIPRFTAWTLRQLFVNQPRRGIYITQGGVGSAQLQEAILKQKFVADLASEAVSSQERRLTYLACSLEKYGRLAVAKARTDNERAVKFEIDVDTLEQGDDLSGFEPAQVRSMELPTLRYFLRKSIILHLINQLGFEPREWNRRN